MTTLVSCQGCGVQTVPDLCCPKCSELGRTSFFCGQECFRSSWKLHSRLHDVIKKSQTTNAQRLQPSNTSASSFDSIPTNNTNTHSNTNYVPNTTQFTDYTHQYNFAPIQSQQHTTSDCTTTGRTDESTTRGGEEASSLSTSGNGTSNNFHNASERSGGVQFSARGPASHTGGIIVDASTGSGRRGEGGSVPVSTSVVTGGIDQYTLGYGPVNNQEVNGTSVTFDRTKLDNTTGNAAGTISAGGNNLKIHTGKLEYDTAYSSYESYTGDRPQYNTDTIRGDTTSHTTRTPTSTSVPDRDADWDNASEPIEVPSTAFGLPPHKFRPVYQNRSSNMSQSALVSAGSTADRVSTGGGGTVISGTGGSSISDCADGVWSLSSVWNIVSNVSRLPRDYEKWRKRKTSNSSSSTSATTPGVYMMNRPVTSGSTKGTTTLTTGPSMTPSSTVVLSRSEVSTATTGSVLGDATISTDRSVVQQIVLLVYSFLGLLSEFCVVLTSLRNRHDVIGRVRPSTETQTSRGMRLFVIVFRVLCATATIYILIFKFFRKIEDTTLQSRAHSSAVLNVLNTNILKSQGGVPARGVST
eukprot:Lankesteria_metandrocarpae@DN9102_c0_g1_i1.p1